MKAVRDSITRAAVILTPENEKDQGILDAILHGEIKVMGCGRMADGTILHLTIGVPVEPEVGRQSCSEADEMRRGGDSANAIRNTLAGTRYGIPGLREDATQHGTEKG